MTLRGSNDPNNSDEQASIERAMKVSGHRPLPEIYWALANAADRSASYVGDPSKARHLELERHVENRLLDELLRDPVYRQSLMGDR